MPGENYAFQNDSGSKWSRAETYNNKWRVQTSTGLIVDFYSKNFDRKHLRIMTDATSFANLQSYAKTVGNTRSAGNLSAHDGGYVSTSNANTTIALSMGNLAAWGGDIALKQPKAPTSLFKGVTQYHITTEIPAAALLTHKKNGAGTSGVHATVAVVCEKVGSTIFVVHFEAAGTGFMRSMKGSGNPLDATILAKREERFKNKHRKPDDMFDLGTLFG